MKQQEVRILGPAEPADRVAKPVLIVRLQKFFQDKESQESSLGDRPGEGTSWRNLPREQQKEIEGGLREVFEG